MAKIIKYIEVDSTQNICRSNYETLDNKSIILAEKQTNGYGRTGSWDSSAKNIYMSVKLENISVTKILYLISSVVVEILRDNDVSAYIKLPNDIYVNQRKIGGLIIEEYDEGYIVGIGINVYELATKERTSLFSEKAKDWKIDQLVSQFQISLEQNIMYQESELVQIWKEYTTLIGQIITITNRKTNNKLEIKVTNVDKDYVYTNKEKYLIMEYKFLY